MRIANEPRLTEPLNMGDIVRELREIRTLLAQAPILWGNEDPEGNVFGSVGYLYLRKKGSTSTTMYVKESGDDTKTGWVAK